MNRKQYDRFRYCEVQDEVIKLPNGSLHAIGIDLRSVPEDDPYDRVCCRCGESLSVDGRCDSCGKL